MSVLAAGSFANESAGVNACRKRKINATALPPLRSEADAGHGR
jgi:hypothetical protein